MHKVEEGARVIGGTVGNCGDRCRKLKLLGALLTQWLCNITMTKASYTICL